MIPVAVLSRDGCTHAGHPHGHPVPRKRAWCCIKHTRRDPPTPDPGRAGPRGGTVNV
jgi:hypothetical protein